MLRRLRGMRGAAKQKLRARASEYRKRMIAANRHHAEDDLPKGKYNVAKLRRSMPESYRAKLREFEKTAEGRKALRRYRAMSGLPFPPEIKVIAMPGPKNKKLFLAGVGKSPEVQIADGDERHVRRVRKIKGRGHVATDASGKRIYILRGKNLNASKPRYRFVGHAPETHYVLSPGEEKAGAFKKGKYWVHSHLDEGGRWPKVFKDQAGNLVYGPGTYRVGKWIRRN
jgi:hypothetical protein